MKGPGTLPQELEKSQPSFSYFFSAVTYLLFHMQVVNYKSPRGGITVLTHRGNGTTGYLLIKVIFLNSLICKDLVSIMEKNVSIMNFNLYPFLRIRNECFSVNIFARTN